MTAVLIMAGGTGGHVYPALAVAEHLRGRGVTVSWLGAPRGLENRVVPEHGFPLHRVTVAGLRGKGPAALVAAPVGLLRALVQALGVVRRTRADVVLGMGGFAAGPGGVAAWLLRRPLVIHEQNAVAGLTNRLLAPLAARVLEAFPGTFPPARRARTTGNPLRASFLADVPGPRPRASVGPLRLLVVGGSLGARPLNLTLPPALATLPAAARAEVRHQCGTDHLQATRDAYGVAGVDATVEPFITDMAAAYRWADLVVCRAGAMTVAEVAAAGVPAILVPLPHAVDDHQSANARHLSDAGAAVLLPQQRLTPETLGELLRELSADPERRARMAAAARALAEPDATRRVAEACLEVAHG